MTVWRLVASGLLAALLTVPTADAGSTFTLRGVVALITPSADVKYMPKQAVFAIQTVMPGLEYHRTESFSSDDLRFLEGEFAKYWLDSKQERLGSAVATLQG